MTQNTQSQQTEESAVQPLKYLKRLQLSEKEKDEAKIQYTVDGQKHNLDGHILETRKEIAKLKGELEDLKNEAELDVEGILEAQLSLEAAKEGLTRLQALKEELF